jgi:hypothetical protein
VSGTATPDMTYSDQFSLMFNKKSVCFGFATLWYDMTNYAGFKTEFIAIPSEDHDVDVTMVNGKWFYVDVTHNDKEEVSNISYDKFLDNGARAFRTNFKGYDLSSKRYSVAWPNGNGNYFESKAWEPDEFGYTTYDATQDRYVYVPTNTEE